MMTPKARPLLIGSMLLVLSAAPALSAAPFPQATLAPPAIGSAAGFLEASQNIPATDYNELTEVYFLLKALRELDPTLSSLDASLRSKLTANLQALQNADGGFGDWVDDRSLTGSTARAAEALAILGAAPANGTAALAFLDSLQITTTVYSNGGYRSSKVDRDADVSSTADAVRAYAALGVPVTNASAVAAYVRYHQNADGGFGLQTNRPAGTTWPSTATATYDGLTALSILGAAPDFPSAGVSFLRGLQNADGGFGFNTGNLTSRAAYTFDALVCLAQLNSTAPNPGAAASFLQGNQLASGGFVENALDPVAGLHTTYFSIRSLAILGSTFDSAAALSYVLGAIPGENDGGFGDHPGTVSNVRFTFDATFALNAIGKRPVDRGAAASYLLSLRNADGGFGGAGLSSAESTSRALVALQLLGEPLPRPDDASRFLRSLQNPDGGFASTAGGPSTVTHTYRAVAGLELLGDVPNSTAAATAFLRAQQQADGGFSDTPGTTGTSLVLTWEAAVALRTLGASPANASQAVTYVLSAQNPDGGFRHAPIDTLAPANFSAALYTYAAVLALDALGAIPANHSAIDEYVARLQSTDGAFADHANFTSAVSDTFSSIIALETLQPTLYDTAPALSALVAGPSPANSTTAVTFSVTYTDVEGQMPVRILLDVNGERHAMAPADAFDLEPRDGKVYTLGLLLPIGNYTFAVTASDGFQSARVASDPSVVEVRFDPGPVSPPNGTLPGNQTNGTLPGNQTNGTLPGNQTNGTLPGNQTNGTLPGNQTSGTPPTMVLHPPEISASVDPPAGGPTTEFRFVATYSQPEGVPPLYVRVQIDTGDWFDLVRIAGTNASAGLTYDFIWQLPEGNHTFRVQVFDGRNAVQTPTMAGPYVTPAGAIRPNAATFAAVQATIQARYGVAITPLEVERGIYEGAFAWKVQVGGAEHFVSLDGATVLDDPRPPQSGGSTPTPTANFALLALAGVAGLAAAGVAVARRKRR